MRRNFNLHLALLVACLPAAASCASSSPIVKAGQAWTGAFAGCERVDLGQLVTSENVQASLLEDVAALIQSNAASLESDFDKLAVGLGAEAVHCAILASESVMAPKVGGMAPRALPQGLVRAKAWLNAHTTTTGSAGGAK